MSDVLVTVRTVTGDSPPLVRCETDVGDLVANWRGREAPEAGTQQHVEVDAPGPLVWSDGPGITATNGASEHGQALTGLVEDIEDDAVAVRIGGSVLLLDVEGEPPLGIVGGRVTVRPSAFELWPTEV